MSENLGTIEYTVDAKVDPLLKANKEVDKSMTDFEKSTGKAEKASKRFDAQLGKLARGVKVANSAMMTGAKYATALGAALGGITAASASAGREIKQMAALSNTSVERFQELAYGASQVGVSAEKLGDIFKDVQDKVGDFLATGGGELADYFENVAPLVGQTADEFRGLSGPDALIKFKQGLDAANLSAAEQIFYLESLANDVSLLQPLLANNAQGFEESAKKARELNLVLSEAEVQQLAEVNREFNQLLATISKMAQKVVAENAPQIKAAIESITQAAIAAAPVIGQFFNLFTEDEDLTSLAEAERRLANVKWQIDQIGQPVTQEDVDKLSELNGQMFILLDRIDQLKAKQSGGTLIEINSGAGQDSAAPLMPSRAGVPNIFETEQGAFGMTDESGVSAYNQSLQDTLGITQELANQLETLDMKFQNIASTIGGTLYEATMSWSDASGQAIAQNIADGETWNEGLNAVASTIATQLLGSLISLGIQYGINAALKGAADTQEAATGAASLAAITAAGTASAATLASAWAPAAAGAAVATAGGAAAAGSAGLTTAYGTAQALSVAGGRLNGGPVSAGQMYQVTEDGRPEMLTIGNKQYLMTGNQSGSVTSNKDMMAAGGGNVSIVVNNNASGAEATAISKQQDGKTIIEVVVADINSKGKIHKAITSNTTASNRV